MLSAFRCFCEGRFDRTFYRIAHRRFFLQRFVGRIVDGTAHERVATDFAVLFYDDDRFILLTRCDSRRKSRAAAADNDDISARIFRSGCRFRFCVPIGGIRFRLFQTIRHGSFDRSRCNRRAGNDIDVDRLMLYDFGGDQFGRSHSSGRQNRTVRIHQGTADSRRFRVFRNLYVRDLFVCNRNGYFDCIVHTLYGRSIGSVFDRFTAAGNQSRNGKRDQRK